MTSSKIELVRRLHPVPAPNLVTFFTERDAARSVLEPLLTADFEAVSDPRQLPMGESRDGARPHNTARGVDAFVAVWAEWISAFEIWRATPVEFIDVDAERVLILLDVVARSRTHGVDMQFRAANLLTIRNGQIARFEMFLDRASAYEAAGIEVAETEPGEPPLPPSLGE